jgi:hypothetical protein
MKTMNRRTDLPGSKFRAVRGVLFLAFAALIVLAGTTLRAGGARRGFNGRGDEDRHDDGRDDRDDDDQDSYAIGLWGDLPYSDAQALTGVPNMIADMNLQDLAFTAHDGDLKAGNATKGSVTPTDCSDALYIQALNYFNSLDAPAVFTTGDNDWTDCDRPSNGGYSSRERLDHERQLFFSTPFTLGKHHLHQEVQTAALCLDAKSNKVPCVENRRWTIHHVTYAVLNIQGSCNNLCDTDPDPDEYAARNAADIAWLHDTFAEAKARNSAAVMLLSQGDPGFDATDPTRSPVRNPKTLVETDFLPLSDPAYHGTTTPLIPTPDGFHDFLVALRQEVIAFEKPVAYVHGDSHYFRIDKPFLDSLGQRLENFTRVETFGDNQANGTNDCNWLKVFVHPRSREVFTYQTQIVPANRVVPAP